MGEREEKEREGEGGEERWSGPVIYICLFLHFFFLLLVNSLLSCSSMGLLRDPAAPPPPIHTQALQDIANTLGYPQNLRVKAYC